jgi:hypothetical protein
MGRDLSDREVRWLHQIITLAMQASQVCLLAALVSTVSAQELVPASYTPAPCGVNLLSLASMYNRGDLAFDPAGPIDEADAKILGSSLGYVRTLNIAGRSANVGLILPYILGDIEGLYLGEPASAHRSGIGDMTFRGAINLYGGPAMSPREFSTYKPRTLIGTSLIIKGPTGQYDSSKLINIGTNRWSFKPEIGVVQVLGRWAIDAYVGAWFFTDNTDFAGGMTREQDPMYSTQAHVRYLIKPGLWAAVDGNFWIGGQTTINGRASDDEQRNSRVGATLSIRLSPKQNLRIAVSTGAITRIGGDFDSIGLSYNYNWMGTPKTN